MDKFELGRTVVTRGVGERIKSEPAFSKFVTASIRKHAGGDWGNVPAESKRSNDAALKDGDRIISAYDFIDGVRVWIITEADRACTTVLYPEEY